MRWQDVEKYPASNPMTAHPMENPDNPKPPRPPSLDRALDLVRFLRANCDWDAAQTPRSLVKHLLEESHEVADAIHADDPELLRDELGDLLLNLAFQVVIAEEAGAFDAESVTAGLEAKMRRRHPHIYGDGEAQDWESIKASERAAADDDVRESSGAKSVLEGVPRTLDPVHKAHRLQELAAGVGFDWPTVDGALEKLTEELEEMREALAGNDPEQATRELGDVLFSVVNVARIAGVHGGDGLERTNREFERRFRFMEQASADQGRRLADLSLVEMERLWQKAKGSPIRASDD